MEGTEFVLAVVAMVMGTGIIIAIIDLFKSWINRNNSSFNEESFDRMAKAFIKHKNDTDRRLQNIEAIITDEDLAAGLTGRQLHEQKSHGAIEMQLDEEQKQEKSNSGNMKNMLDKKRAT